VVDVGHERSAARVAVEAQEHRLDRSGGGEDEEEEEERMRGKEERRKGWMREQGGRM